MRVPRPANRVHRPTRRRAPPPASRAQDGRLSLVPGPRAEQEYRVFTTGEYLAEEHLLKPPSETSLTEKKQLTSRLKVFGIEPTKAQELSTMFPDRVSNWLTVAEGGGLSKKVKNVPGYLIRAIEQDYSIIVHTL